MKKQQDENLKQSLVEFYRTLRKIAQKHICVKYGQIGSGGEGREERTAFIILRPTNTIVVQDSCCSQIKVWFV